MSFVSLYLFYYLFLCVYIYIYIFFVKLYSSEKKKNKAVACEHEEVVRILLISGANPLLKDEDDETPVSLATNLAIKEMLNKAVNGQLPDNVSRKKSVTFDVSVKKDDDDDDNDDGIGEEDSDSDSNLETDEEEEDGDEEEEEEEEKDGDGENDNGRGVEKSSQQSTFSTLLSPSSSSSSSNLNTTNHPSYAETFVYSRHSGEDSINRHEPNYSDDIDKTFSWFNPSSWPGSTTAKVISVGAVAVIGALALRAVLGKRRRARK